MILVALGANLPGPGGSSPLETARRAALELDELAGLRVRAQSHWYLTEPVPPSGQPPYVNGMALLVPEGTGAEPDPAILLTWLQTMESRAGRERGMRNAPRTLDLDIIAMGEGGRMIRVAPDPVLPHPRAHLRAFVLLPLLDVAPGWIHPVARQGAEELLANLPRQEVRRLT